MTTKSVAINVCRFQQKYWPWHQSRLKFFKPRADNLVCSLSNTPVYAYTDRRQYVICAYCLSVDICHSWTTMKKDESESRKFTLVETFACQSILDYSHVTATKIYNICHDYGYCLNETVPFPFLFIFSTNTNFDVDMKVLLNRKFHISQISHRVKYWYLNITVGKCEICVWSILIILGV